MVDAGEMERRRRVVAYIETRVKKLRLTWKEVADTAKVTESLIRRIRRDPRHGITSKTASGLDKALQLVPGSIDRMLAGESDPEPLEGTGPPRPRSPGDAALSDDTPPNIMDIVRRWNRRLSPEDAAQLAEDLLTVRVGSHQQGYNQGFEDGLTAARQHA